MGKVLRDWTEAHSTLRINQKTPLMFGVVLGLQKEHGQPFGMAKDQGSGVKIEAGHDGYRTCLSKTMHKRTWGWVKNICD